MDTTPPAKRKKIAVESMDIDDAPPSPSPITRSPLPRRCRVSSPLPHRVSSPSSPLHSHRTSSSSSSHLHPHHPSSFRSPVRTRSRSRSPLPSSRLSTPPRSPLPPSPLVESPSPPEKEEKEKEKEQDEEEEEEDEDRMDDGATTHSTKRKRRTAASGTSGGGGGGGAKGGTKHEAIAKVKKVLNERLHSIKTVLMPWLQKYLGDHRLGDYVNKIHFHIDPSAFATKFPVSVVASPIVNDPTFVKIAQDLSGPILSDYPGIFVESDISEEIKESSEAHGLVLNQMTAEVLADIFGKCWDSLGGLIKFHGSASVSINGTPKYYDLVLRYWIKEA